MADYNGWKNRATWNVALWLNNDETLYAWHQEHAHRNPTYASFLAAYGELLGATTPDGVAWDDDEIDTDALDEMFAEAVDG